MCGVKSPQSSVVSMIGVLYNCTKDIFGSMHVIFYIIIHYYICIHSANS